MSELIPVVVPDRYSKWFKKHRQWPVQVQLDSHAATVVGGAEYQIRRLSPTRVAVYKTIGSEFLPVGEIHKNSIVRPLSDAARHDLGVIRSAIFGVTYPAPLAYELPGKELVHPGECFSKHRSALVQRTLFSINDEEVRCAVCKEAFE